MSIREVHSAPYVRATTGISELMGQVMLALVPATLAGIVFFGWPALWLFLVTLASALLCEALCLKLAGKAAAPRLRDGSALLTGWLLAMTLPPWAPWWIGVVGAVLAIGVGKQVYGGLGQNLFNPAMLARVALLISFPLEMTAWIEPTPWFGASSPGFADSLAITFAAGVPDGHAGATAIGGIKTEFTQGRMPADTLPQYFGVLRGLIGWHGGSLGETSSLALLCGGLWLIRRRVIAWHIPLAVLGAVALLATLTHLADPARYPGPLFHLFSGALMLTAFFIATDYVTSPNNPVGQWVFGLGCGSLIFVIRTWGGYPEGAGFAVLLMNAATPLIDHYLPPRIYGRDRQRHPLELENKP